MRSLLQIANTALMKIGASPINSFDDEIKEADYAKQRLPEVVAFILRDYTWAFAKRYIQLEGERGPDIPPFWTFKIKLPTGSIKLLGLDDVLGEVQYERMGDYLLTNRAPAILRYVALPIGGSIAENKEVFPEDFAEAAACMLASELAHTISGSQALKDVYLNDYSALIRKARHNGAVERGTPVVIESDDWIIARRAGNYINQPNVRPLDYPPEGSPFNAGP